MDGGETTSWVDELVEALRRQRHLLEVLRFRFVALELVLEAREVRFLSWALADLDRARLQVREADLARAAVVSSLNLKGARGAPSLREVAAVAPAPWAGILRDHHDSLSTVITEIEVHAHRIAQHGRDGLAELARTGTLSTRSGRGPVPASGVAVPSGGAVALAPAVPAVERLRAPGQAEDLDPVAIEALLDDVIAAAGRLRVPGLLAFLR